MEGANGNMKIGIIGYGEIGKAVERVYLEKDMKPCIRDFNFDDGLEDCDFLHICIPYTKGFVPVVERYIDELNPNIIIVHSTVAPGTIERLSRYYKIAHSPVRGVHPDLYEGIMTFVKVVSGNAAHEVSQHFEQLGITTSIYDNPVTSEVAKLLSTTYYGVCIAFHDYARKVCEATGANFEQAMTEWNTDYNEGYRELDMPHVARPVLYPPQGSIGGHCVIPNAEIIKETEHSPLVQSILDLKN